MSTGQVNPDVFAIGDAAVIQDNPLPATAQGTCLLSYTLHVVETAFIDCAVANQKAKYLSKKLNKMAKGKEHLEPFAFHNMGSLAYLGGWQAIYDRTKTERVKTKEAGRFAWLLWRSAYFTRTLSVRNKYVI